jgi:Fe-S oxidoreductase
MVTRDEAHSTRGRARLLFEMLDGEAIDDGWRSEEVRDALDLCLACKGCRSDCPVGVDMATYKAEFLSHYYAGRVRPRSAYALGLIGLWSRIGGRLPRVANFATRAPGLRTLTSWLAGATTERRMPAFARRSFRSWFQQRGGSRGTGPAVLLWPDTFNDHFHPHTAQAATEVLEALGHRVVLPDRPLCCGRPLYDYGMLGTARRWLLQLLDELRTSIAAGVPVIGLEPSCVAVFRDELCGLLPNDEDARRLGRQAFTLAEFLSRSELHWPEPLLSGRALVQPHCHQHAVLGQEPENEVLRRLGLEVELADAGCCGMAGAFGFEKDHYELSIQVGERALLPKIRALAPDVWVVADGFSCREQIAGATTRRGVHLAEVVHAALRRSAGDDLPHERPERDYWDRDRIPPLEASIASISGS